MKSKIICNLIGFLTGAIVVSVISLRSCVNADFTESLQTDTIRVRDTLVIHDTIRVKETKPYYVEVVRVDTVATIDTVTITVPIEQKTYQNEDFKAVIEGYKPSLITMDIYKKTTFIRDTIRINNTVTRMKPPRWVICIGPAIGYGANGFEPYIGINAGFVIWGK